MTGRDLIIYILQNDLEDKPIFEDGKLLGFINVVEASAKFNVGPSTVFAWIDMGWLDAIRIGNRIYIPANADLKGKNNVS